MVRPGGRPGGRPSRAPAASRRAGQHPFVVPRDAVGVRTVHLRRHRGAAPFPLVADHVHSKSPQQHREAQRTPTVSPVVTVIKPAFSPTTAYLSSQQSHRRIAAHIPVRSTSRVNSFAAQVSLVACSSATVTGFRLTVPIALLTRLWKGFIPSVRCGWRCRNVARRSFSGRFREARLSQRKCLFPRSSEGSEIASSQALGRRPGRSQTTLVDNLRAGVSPMHSLTRSEQAVRPDDPLHEQDTREQTSPNRIEEVAVRRGLGQALQAPCYNALSLRPKRSSRGEPQTVAEHLGT